MYNENHVAQSPSSATSQTPPITANALAANNSPTVSDMHHHNININLSRIHPQSHSHHHLQTHPHTSLDGQDHRNSTLPSLHSHHMEMQMPHLQLSHQHKTQQQQQIHLPRHAAISPRHIVQQQDPQQHNQIQHQQQQQGVLNHQTSVSQMQQSQQHPQQQQSTMFTRFDANKSTKGASKLRRDLINTEIANLRDLLPLPQSTRQRLSQLQLMALVCVYVRKANYFQQVFKRHDISMFQAPTPNIGFSKALSGFLMMLTQNGKLLYISDNAAEYLGHSMEDLLIHGDSVYDIIDKQDHTAIQAELNRNIPPVNVQHSTSSDAGIASSSSATNFNSLEGSHRMFLCRMNVSRNARRQMRFGDQKVVLVQGHYLSFLPLCSRNEPVFLATCTPIAMPETRECVVQGATNVFTTIHSMDMKIVHIDKNGEFHLGYTKSSIQGLSWYSLIHSDSLREAQGKHRLITQSEQDRSCILLIRMQRKQSDFIWVHVVLQVRDSQDSNQQPVIVCTNQILNESEASVMITNSWLYHYYAVQSKVQFSIPYDGDSRVPPTNPAVSVAATAYYHHHQHGSHIGLAFSESFPGNIGTYPTVHPHHGHHPTPSNYHALQHQMHEYHNIATCASYQPTPSVHCSPYLENLDSHATHQQHQNLHKSNIHANYSNREYNEGRERRVTAGESTLCTNSKSGKDTNTNHRQSHNRLSTEPVDFSQLSSCTTLHECRSPNERKSIIRCNNSNSSVSSHAASTLKHRSDSTSSRQIDIDFTTNSKPPNDIKTFRHSPPPSKKRVISKLEPLYLSDEQTNLEENSANSKIGTSHSLYSVTTTGSNESHSTSVIFASVVPTRPRFPSKGFVSEPPDFIEQWNPSPPWSENAQKLTLDSSSSSHQELSPYITTTPPTPNSAAPSSVGSTECQILGPAFSFEWMSDQLVPIVDPCISCLTPERVPVMLTHGNRQLWPPSTTLSSTQHHHHHISQHLASHAHHLLSLQTGGLINPAVDVNSLEDVTTKKETLENIDDKGSSSN